MARPEKVAVVEEIQDRLTSAGATVLTEYRGLTVPEIARLREALKETGTQYKVFKNTLARRAAEGAELTDIVDLLEGPTAFAFVDGDVVGAAKALREFGRSNEALVVKGGLLSGRFITADQVEELAKLPSRQELLARIAGGFKAPAQKAAGLFSALQRNTAYALKALIDKRVEAGEEAPPEAGADTGGEGEVESGDEESAPAPNIETGGDEGEESAPAPNTETAGEDAQEQAEESGPEEASTEDEPAPAEEPAPADEPATGEAGAEET